jgi:starvation-inducible DNA-binding protein
MFPTRNDLPESNRSKVVDLLNTRLADAIDAHSQTKQAHWNVKGPQFYSLHKLFDAVAEKLEDSIDELAERAVQLGGTAEGTLRQAAKRSTLAEYAPKGTGSRAHAEALATTLAAFGKGIRAAIDVADELNDKGTSDLLTGISRGADESLWMVEAHLQGE